MRHHHTPQPSTTHRPLVLVDIDGVLNAFHSDGHGTHQRVAVAGGYRVVLDTRHPGWFDALAEVAELRWATMWQAHAGPVFGAVAGLGHDWPHLDFDGAYAAGSRYAHRTGTGVGGYKWPRILEAADTGRAMVWIDDDMIDAQLAWAAARHAGGAPTLFVRPDPADGFTEAEYAEVLAFAREHAARRDDTTTTAA